MVGVGRCIRSCRTSIDLTRREIEQETIDVQLARDRSQQIKEVAREREIDEIDGFFRRGPRWKRGERREDLPDQVRAVPHGGARWRAQAGSQPSWPLRPSVRHHPRLRLLHRQQEHGRCLGGRHPLRLPAQPQEVHPGYQDGIPRPEEAAGAHRPHCLPQGIHRLTHSSIHHLLAAALRMHLSLSIYIAVSLCLCTHMIYLSQ
uniref:Uncharacterized protein n=1 Tax=Oryza punctata TaxID=4537 RepID=A0A0E0KXC5_ORYPU